MEPLVLASISVGDMSDGEWKFEDIDNMSILCVR